LVGCIQVIVCCLNNRRNIHLISIADTDLEWSSGR
jgi:hypothetical protein